MYVSVQWSHSLQSLFFLRILKPNNNKWTLLLEKCPGAVTQHCYHDNSTVITSVLYHMTVHICHSLISVLIIVSSFIFFSLFEIKKTFKKTLNIRQTLNFLSRFYIPFSLTAFFLYSSSSPALIPSSLHTLSFLSPTLYIPLSLFVLCCSLGRCVWLSIMFSH